MRRLHSQCKGLALVVLLSVGATAHAQSRAAEEGKREQWQRVPDVFEAMDIRPGATVADVGAGDGFFTARLARAVGPEGRVFAVDIDDRSLERLRRRLQEDGIRNVIVVKGAPDDPKLPDRVLDSALIVNAYHEMKQHQAIMTALRRALKEDGRLVIVEPIRDSRRGRARAEQAREHEIEPEFVLHDARAAGFRVVGLQDPFAIRGADVEWLLALQPADRPITSPETEPAEAETDADLKDPALRIAQEEFKKLSAQGAVVIVDVRGDESFAAGHIPGALSIPLGSIEERAEQLRALGKPIVTYCS